MRLGSKKMSFSEVPLGRESCLLSLPVMSCGVMHPVTVTARQRQRLTYRMCCSMHIALLRDAVRSWLRGLWTGRRRRRSRAALLLVLLELLLALVVVEHHRSHVGAGACRRSQEQGWEEQERPQVRQPPRAPDLAGRPARPSPASPPAPR